MPVAFLQSKSMSAPGAIKNDNAITRAHRLPFTAPFTFRTCAAAPVNSDICDVVREGVDGTDTVPADGALVGVGTVPLNAVVLCVGVAAASDELKDLSDASACVSSVAVIVTLVLVVYRVDVSSVVEKTAR